MKFFRRAPLLALLASLAWTGGAAAQSAAQPPATAENDPMLARGNSLLAQGDIAAARLFLERAATAGNATAAMVLGTTYDPLYFRKWNVVGTPPEPAKAAEWYRRALAGGDARAAVPLRELVESGAVPQTASADRPGP